MTELPTVSTVRDRITATQKKPIRYALALQYLGAARAKEIIARVSPNDKSGKNKATGPKGSDTRITEYKGHEVAIFNLYTQKRDGLKRVIALPLEFEPLAEPLHNYMKEFCNTPVFNFTRQKLWLDAKKVFKGLTYPIYKYSVYDNGELVKVTKKHKKQFTTHALRHLRASELIEYYGFTGFNLAVYGGWTMQTAVRVSGMFDRYVSLDWQSYVDKLLIPREW